MVGSVQDLVTLLLISNKFLTTKFFNGQIEIINSFVSTINDVSKEMTRNHYESLLMETTQKLKGVQHFRLGLLIPFLSKVGMICSQRLQVADYAIASKDLDSGSYDFLNKEGNIPTDRHQLTYFQLCEYLKVDVSEATGESNLYEHV